jgi:hypothetical protein
MSATHTWLRLFSSVECHKYMTHALLQCTLINKWFICFQTETEAFKWLIQLATLTKHIIASILIAYITVATGKLSNAITRILFH